MIRIKQHIILLLVLLTLGNRAVYSQDEFIQNLDQIPSYINPSFHAFNEGTMIGVVNEFAGESSMNNTENRYAFFNSFFKSSKYGLGMDILSTRLRNSAYQNTKVNLSYIYRVQLDRFWIFYPGITAGYTIASFNYDNIIFQDQIDVLTGNVSNYTIDPVILSDRTSAIDFGLSFLVQNRKNTLAGISIKHLNRPKISFVDEDKQRIDMHVAAQLGYQIQLNRYNRRGLLPRHSYFYFFGNASMQGKQFRFDLFQQLLINEFSIGLSQQLNKSDIYDTGQLGVSTALHIESMLVGLNYKMPISPNAKRFIPNVMELFLTFNLTDSRGRRDRNYNKFYAHKYTVF